MTQNKLNYETLNFTEKSNSINIISHRRKTKKMDKLQKMDSYASQKRISHSPDHNEKNKLITQGIFKMINKQDYQKISKVNYNYLN